MRNRFSFKSALVGGLFVALLVSAVPVGAAVGDAIRAGQTTSANKTTNLKGSAEFQNLKVTNTRAVGVAARFVVEPGNPPFHVSSGVVVPKLNADRVDGVNAAGLLKKKDYDPDKDGSVVSVDTVEGVALSNILPGGTLPAGATIRGVYGVGGDEAGYLAQGISFGYTLASEPIGHYIESGAAAPAECPGSASMPEAAPGHLCLYEGGRLALTGPLTITDAQGRFDRTNQSGFFLVATPASVTGPNPLTSGTWAVTAPAAGAAPGARQDAAGSIYGD